MCQKWKHGSISNTIERHISQLSLFIKNIDGFVRHRKLKVSCDASKIQGGPFADHDFAHEFGKWG